MHNELQNTLPGCCLTKRKLCSFRARLHRALASTVRQHCDDANDTVLIENNGVT